MKPGHEIVVTPLDFRPNPKGGDPLPADPVLYDALLAYCREEFGMEPKFWLFTRAWCVAEIVTDGGQRVLKQILGVDAVQNTLDCPVFHVGHTGEKDREQEVLEMRATKELLTRSRNYLKDVGCSGRLVLVYVSDEQYARWEKMLASIGAVPAQRYALSL